ncbi:ESX secretion-associated protein EspG [Williamsia sterculiae]|uniref:EspG family protein n=1 Tax=Williamsia sterculiae TaxID=1344003 RepID=A0A1N7GSM6_9NOCA|nr:ESX secretion-associated protein EspG [Williamsia sterculiae]SIS15603.1 EspG family protein [Williamsia sterculiae]
MNLTVFADDVSSETVLTAAQWTRLGEHADVQTWPVVLDLEPRFDTHAERAAAARDHDAALTAAGLFDHGEVDADLRSALTVVADPERMLAVRRFAGDGTVRACLARRGDAHVWLVRTGDTIRLRRPGVADDTDIVALITTLLGAHDTPDFVGISAPAEELAGRLNSCETTANYADALYAVGAGQQDAVVVASALQACDAHTEIVAEQRVDGVVSSSLGALAIFESPRGRIVAGPSMSPDGRVWTTLSRGTSHRIGQALHLLIETLPDSRWMP